MDLHQIGRLRKDSNLRYLYKGEQKKDRGRPKKYDGKVQFNDLSRWEFVKEVKTDILFYTLIVNSSCFEMDIKVVILPHKKKLSYTLLFSTDLKMSASDIFKAYKARFQIEFIFRDAKKFTGLNQCQARKKESLNFHFNASLSALNLIKKQDRAAYKNTTNKDCSIASWTVRYFNKHLLEQFILHLDLDPTLIKNHPQYLELCNYGAVYD